MKAIHALRVATRRLSFRRVVGATVLTFAAAQAAADGGTAKPTVISVSPAAVTLNTAVGSISSVTVSVSNTTQVKSAIVNLGVTGPQANEYALSGTCGINVLLDRSVGPCTFNVTFAPAALGARSATLVLTFANAPAITVPFNGTGIAAVPTTAQIRVDNLPAGTTDFGQTAVSGAQPPNVPVAPDLMLLISDTGTGSLLHAESIIGANSGDFTLNGFVGAGQQPLCTAIPILTIVNVPCRLGIHFAPTALGVRTAIVRITSNDPNRPTIDIPVTGVGIAGVDAAPPPVASFTNVSGRWGSPGEIGSALNIAHDKGATDRILAGWETFDTTGQAVWFELRDGQWTDPQTWTGSVHRFTGSPFTGAAVSGQLVDTTAGTATLTFTTSTTGTLAFSINGFSGTKPITLNPSPF